MTAYAPRNSLADSATMLRRNLLHLRRYPSLTVMVLGLPIVFLLLFVYVFGGTLGSGLGPGLPAAATHTAITGRAAYASYVAPAIILLTAAAVAQGTAISVASDMTEGIIARFRTMAIAPSSVLTGHVLGSMIQAVLSMAVVTGVAIGVGFRPTATPLEWLAAAGLLVLVALAFTWLTVALGLAAKSVETASNLPMFLLSAAVPGQRVRAHPLDAGRAALVRPVPAVHPGHRDPAGPAAGHRDRRPGLGGHRLVRGPRRGRLPVGEIALPPSPVPLIFPLNGPAVPPPRRRPVPAVAATPPSRSGNTSRVRSSGAGSAAASPAPPDGVPSSAFRAVPSAT